MRSPVQIWLAAPENRRFHNENGGFSNILLQLKSSSKVVGAILVTGAIFFVLIGLTQQIVIWRAG